MPTVCQRVLYRGRVQGVGFRATAAWLAEGRQVTGYVRNLPDGRVELVAEGPSVAVDEFLAALAERMADYIAGADVETRPPEGHAGFRVRH
jgi:acylphosphatase